MSNESYVSITIDMSNRPNYKHGKDFVKGKSLSFTYHVASNDAAKQQIFLFSDLLLIHYERSS
jgi:hypothetical protein